MNCEYKVLRFYANKSSKTSGDVVATFYKESDAFYWARYQQNLYQKSNYIFALEDINKRVFVSKFPKTYKEYKNIETV